MGQSAIDEIDHAFDPDKGENVELVKHPLNKETGASEPLCKQASNVSRPLAQRSEPSAQTVKESIEKI